MEREAETGTPAGREPPVAGWRDGIPWAVVGWAVAAIAVVLLVLPRDRETNTSLGEPTGQEKSSGDEVAVDVDLDALRRAAEQDSTMSGYINLSLAYHRAGEYEKTIEACQRALEADPARSGGARLHATAYNNICSAHIRLQRWDQAIEACETAMNIDPDFELPRNNLAEAQRRSGR